LSTRIKEKKKRKEKKKDDDVLTVHGLATDL
jgi:hypothetical protein